MNAAYLTITFIYAVGCCCLGLLLLSFLLKTFKDDVSCDWVAIIASAFLLGQAVLANVWLLTGLGGFFSPVLVWGVFLGTAGTSLVLLWRKRAGLLAPVGTSIAGIRNLSWYWQGLGLLIVVLFLNFGVKAIVSPPLGDAETFYMVLPKIMAASRRLVPQPNYYAFTQIGLSGEMHYAALMSIASPPAAKLFTWFTALALAGMLIGLNAEVGNSGIGKIVSLALLFSSTTVTSYIFDGKVDIFGAAFGLAAYYWALRTENTPGRAPYLLAGLFTGFAIIAKFSNATTVVPGVLILIIWNNLGRQADLKERYAGLAKGLTVFGLMTLCAMIPHFIKNYALFGEPFAPFLFLRSGGERWAEQVWFSKETTKYIVMTYPIALLYGQYPMQGGNISVLALAFAPLFLVLPKRDELGALRSRRILIAALAGVILWIIARPSVMSPRYIMATLLLFIPVVASGVERLFSNESGRFTLLRPAAFLSMPILLIAMIPYHDQVISLNTFRQFVAHLVSNQTDYPPDMRLETVNRHALPGERVFFAGYYGYSLSPEALQCLNGPKDWFFHPVKQPSTDKFNWSNLYDSGFNYLLLDKGTHGLMTTPLTKNTAPTWLSVTKVFEDGRYLIYTIRSLDPGKKSSYACVQVNPYAWDVVKTSEMEKI